VIVNAGSYGNVIRILPSPGFVVLTHEMTHETRIISVEGRPHVSASIRQYRHDRRPDDVHFPWTIGVPLKKRQRGQAAIFDPLDTAPDWLQRASSLLHRHRRESITRP
jgi:hypothetical protein